MPAAGSAGANSGMSIAGFVTGLLGLLFCWFAFVGVPLGLLGVVLGAVALSKAKTDGSKTGLAKAGIVLGALGVVIAVVLISVVAANM
jgi:hypothetical protein